MDTQLGSTTGGPGSTADESEGAPAAPVWVAVEPDDFGGREPASVLLEREHTSLRYGNATFEFTVDTGERSDAGLIRQIRLSLRETGHSVSAGDGEAAQPVALEIVVRPRIMVASIGKLGPLDLPALRQAARRLLQAGAAQVTARR